MGGDPFGGFSPIAEPGFVPGSVSADIGRAIFITILIVQTLLIVILAPALTSGAISMEREKQTLELLITTPVSTLGMVTGKLISSLGFVLLLILASIPLMSAVFAFGGVAPEDVFKAYIVLFATAFGYGSIGLFMSALIKRTQMATALSYLVVLMLTMGSVVLHVYWYGSSGQVADDFGFQRTGQSAPDALVWLNPFVADVDLLCTAVRRDVLVHRHPHGDRAESSEPAARRLVAALGCGTHRARRGVGPGLDSADRPVPTMAAPAAPTKRPAAARSRAGLIRPCRYPFGL
jgi:hypothetical protein